MTRREIVMCWARGCTQAPDRETLRALVRRFIMTRAEYQEITGKEWMPDA
jgi:hypothetical protein